MSSNIDIKSEGTKTFSLDIRARSIDFEMWDDQGIPDSTLTTVSFDLTNSNDRDLLLGLVSILQNLINSHKEFE